MKHYFLRVFVLFIILVHCQRGRSEQLTTPSSCPTRLSNDFRGPPGITGQKGEKGESSKTAEMAIVEKTVSDLQRNISKIFEKLRCIDGVVVGNTCYKLLYRVGVSVNYERARSLCTFHGGALLEIPTEEVFNAVFDYVKANWYIDINHPNSTYVHCWLGSTYDGNGSVILTSGRRGYVKWYPGYPIARASWTHVALRVHIKPEDRTFGMFNVWPENNHRDAPLCQFQLE